MQKPISWEASVGGGREYDNQRLDDFSGGLRLMTPRLVVIVVDKKEASTRVNVLHTPNPAHGLASEAWS